MNRSTDTERTGWAASGGIVAAAVLAAACLLASEAKGSPQGVLTPTVTCVDVNEDGSITAHFGYVNTWSNQVTVPAGKGPPGQQNMFVPSPPDRGQPSQFASGSYDDVFTVTFTEPSLEWRLGDVNGSAGSAVATADSPRCTSVPAAGLDSPWPVIGVGVGLGAALLVRRRSAGGVGV